MEAIRLADLLLSDFPHTPTDDQQKLIQKLDDFVHSTTSDKLFVLKGYAGTGKTTVVAELVKAMKKVGRKAVLMAPTGRAAKVFSGYAQQAAFTIHKMIYQVREDENGHLSLSLRHNKHKDTIFMVDEASMIQVRMQESSGYDSRSLLDDLIHFVFQGKNCHLLLIGDPAQLPPVGMDHSEALSGDYLRKNYRCTIRAFELKEVVRQQEGSGILTNATRIRLAENGEEIKLPGFKLGGFRDIIRISGMELEEALQDAYAQHGAEETMVLCRSNKSANLFNQQIRTRIRWLEGELTAGDYLMVVRNNYYWLDDDSKAGFIANGDTVEILRVKAYEENYGFRFADVVLRLVDYPDEPDLEVKLLLDTITSPSASLGSHDSNRLYRSVMADQQDVVNKKELMKKVKGDPYLNALQVKFAYAVTCHKAQGGQWEAVFVDQGYLTDDMRGAAYQRWLYTAITRATEKLYLVNFNESFFDDSLAE